jgi:hypothetical protein
MEVNEFIASGLLELYVFGKTTEDETQEVVRMAREHQSVRDEILSIEKAVVSLSYSMSPYLSAQNYHRIREALLGSRDVVVMPPRRNWAGIAGWAAAVLLLAGGIYQYSVTSDTQQQLAETRVEKANLDRQLQLNATGKANAENMLAFLRDENTKAVGLGGQAAAPNAKARIYWNQSSNRVFVDASALPEPPAGKVYQIWSLTLNPLTPTSIGLLEDFKGNTSRMFEVQGTQGAQAFGITLEPAGGSPTPTMDQLYVLGQV